MAEEVIVQDENSIEELPKWLPERLERAKKSAVQALLHELGFEEVEGLRQTLSTQAEQIAQLSADQMALTEQLSAAQAARQSALIEAAFRVEAGVYPFVNLEEARTFVNLSEVQVGYEGVVTGMREAITTLVESRPHLLRRFAPVLIEAGSGMEGGHFRPATAGELPPPAAWVVPR